jgi:ubiquinone/menaquinone biosynthesis C-methylase UbiE
MADSHAPLTTEMETYYAEGREADRLASGYCRLERERTQELAQRYLPPPPGEVLDVGGGAGAYAYWLAGLGYTVHLVDAMPLHVEQAERAAREHPAARLASIRVGDARRLEQADESVDAVLLLGPLYHLTEQSERARAWAETRRVLRSGGVVLAAGISRFTSLLGGLHLGFLEDPEFAAIVERDLREGQHRNPGRRRGYFTTAYFHRPEELRSEALEAGLQVDALIAVEGPAGLVGDFEGWWNDPDRRSRLLGAIRAVEREPSLLGVSPHIMVVARKA